LRLPPNRELPEPAHETRAQSPRAKLDLKILVSSFTFPPQADGVSEAARTQSAGFAERGHEVTVATGFVAARTLADSPPGVTVRQFKVSGAGNVRGGCQGDTAGYGQFIASYDGDIILCNCWQVWATDVAIDFFPKTRARKVLISHGFAAHIWHPYRRFAWGWGQWLRAQPYVLRLPRMMKAFDRLVFLSPRCDAGRFFDHWVACRLFPDRVSIIPNGVHFSELEKAGADFRQRWNINTKYLLLNVANYCDRKNQIATLRDFMRANRPDATLVFIGSEFNDYSAKMKSLHDSSRARFPRARVVFLEKIPRQTINAAYRAADVFVLSATEETQPLAILDAMACGVPFISTNVGCVSDFPGGRVVPSGGRTTRAIHQLLDDPGLRRQLGEQGKAACVARYDWNQVINAYDNLFARICNNQSGSFPIDG
jgi:glycosyltransferase involved in cell wall biosynthesis